MAEGCCSVGAVETSARLRDVPSLRRAGAGAVLLAAGWLIPQPADAFPVIAALVVAASSFVPGALRDAARRRIHVGTLMTIGAAGALALGEIVEAALLAVLFAFAEGLEAHALLRGRRGLRSLLELVPPRVVVRTPDGDRSLDTERLRPGDVMVVPAGGRIATDGHIRRGRSVVDLSGVTGESLPVEVGPGDEVFAGTVNGDGTLEVQASTAVGHSSLARLVETVERAQERKDSAQRIASRIAALLVPAVLAVAGIVALVGSVAGDPTVWVHRAVVVVVAAAPCAFALSVPITVVAATGAATRAGIVFKGGAALEALAGAQVVALDKTGTVTGGSPAVVDVVAADGTSPERLLQLAAALESGSDHPLAAAITAAAGDVTPASDVRHVPGTGLEGDVEGHRVRVGTVDHLAAVHLAGGAEVLRRQGATVVAVELAGAAIGLIAVRDEPRPEAADTVAQLTALGLGPVVILTGDHASSAAEAAAAIGIVDVRAGLRPSEKVVAVEGLRKRGRVAMVGDGLNDAGALATADVGVALGAMGNDLAIGAADVVLLGDDLRHLPDAFRHARRAMRIARQNLVLSGGLLALLIPFAVTGRLGLAAVVIVHEAAEVAVVLNGLRAGRRRSLAHHHPTPVPPGTTAPPAARSPSVPAA